LKIGLILYGSIKTLTGGNLYDRYLVEHLKARGHDLRLFSLPMRIYPLRLADNFRAALLRLLRREGCDVLIQDELCHPSFCWGNRRLMGQLSLPVVALVHHLFSSETRSKWLNILFSQIEKRYLQSVDGYIFNSQTTRKTVFDLSGRHKPYIVAPPGGDRLKRRLTGSEIEKRALDSSAMRLLYLGLVIKRKGLLPLIHTLQGLSISTWQLDVVGSLSMDGEYVRQVKRAINTCGLSFHIRLWGTLSDQQVTDKMAQAHLLSMPYAYEGFGIATLEALRLGVPVLGSATGATPEIIRPDINGLLFEPEDCRRVRQSIEALHRDRARLARMSLAAFCLSTHHPTWQQSMERIELFSKQMIMRGSRDQN
jgi:glycosyltransferase involved in cell wall biosynthesis